MIETTYIAYKGVCGKCNAIVDIRSDVCPNCSATFAKRGYNLRKMSKHLKGQQKKLMQKLNGHGNYGHLDELSLGEMDELLKQISEAYHGIAMLIDSQ